MKITPVHHLIECDWIFLMDLPFPPFYGNRGGGTKWPSRRKSI